MSKVRGQAGSGLGDEKAVDQFGENAQIGALGERQYQEILQKAGYLDIYDTWFSVKVPDKSGRKKTRTDVDVVISSGNKILLIDVKRWAATETTSSGKRRPIVYWSIPFTELPMKNFKPIKAEGRVYNKSQYQVGGADSKATDQDLWRLSKSMVMARDRFSKLLPGYDIMAIVVFVPTTKNGSGPASVRFLKWPGGIKSYSSGGSLSFLRKWLGPSAKTGEKAAALLSRMTYTRN